MKKQPKPKTNNSIDVAYINTMLDAAIVHNPVAPMAERLADVLGAIGALDIRRPNDWQFHYTGCVELRWYDGPGDSFSGSNRSVHLTVFSDHAGIGGRMGSRNYRSEDAISINHMAIDDALKVLRVLVGMIDTPMTEEK